MIEIKFKIFTSFIEEDDNLKGEYGYFLVKINNECYGEYREDIDLDILSMNIYDWFSNFIQAILLIKSNDKVYISDVETPEVWIKLVKSEENLQISEVRADKPEGSLSVEADIELNEKSTVWESLINLQDFQKELILKVEQYVAELKNLNTENNELMKELEILLEKIKR
ncbi:hypothetical protein [Enterococcus sp. AZ192]|uniref:hypothetical protein n=1 Tax=unclassified Enterococcus TaxID=2608891 RepID=UPI003D2DD28C